ncbi:hypothetical protein TNCV_3417631 [Trichonephila clavipes]|nr:hypothetical protein TNCV_3417631 [Trichonephila clavipes]
MYSSLSECIGGKEFPCSQLICRIPKSETKIGHGVIIHVPPPVMNLEDDLKQQRLEIDSGIPFTPYRDSQDSLRQKQLRDHALSFIRMNSLLIAAAYRRAYRSRISVHYLRSVRIPLRQQAVDPDKGVYLNHRPSSPYTVTTETKRILIRNSR